MGQFMSQGGVNAWRICPILQGRHLFSVYKKSMSLKSYNIYDIVNQK